MVKTKIAKNALNMFMFQGLDICRNPNSLSIATEQ